MPAYAVHGADASSAVVHDVAARTRAHAEALGREVWERVAAVVPGADEWDEALLAAGRASADENFRVLSVVLDPDVEHGPIAAPLLALAHARQFARTSTPLSSLLHSYQVGHEVWRDFYVDVLGDFAQTPAQLAGAAHRVDAGMFAFLYAVTAQVVSAYEEERRRIGGTGEQARAEAVRALLAGEDVDTDAVSMRFGFDLRAHHTALVAWAPGHDGGSEPEPALEALLRTAAAAVGVVRPLIVSPGGPSTFAWLTRAAGEGPPLDERLRSLALDTNGLRIVCGSEARGAAGFRRSHHEALAARRSLGRPDDAAGLASYHDVEFASLLLEDRARCRAWMRRELGRLARTDAAAERLRATLEALLAAESNATRTAERLNVHRNTVAYRLRQAEAARGAPLAHRRLELEAALRLARSHPELLGS